MDSLSAFPQKIGPTAPLDRVAQEAVDFVADVAPSDRTRIAAGVDRDADADQVAITDTREADVQTAADRKPRDVVVVDPSRVSGWFVPDEPTGRYRFDTAT